MPDCGQQADDLLADQPAAVAVLVLEVNQGLLAQGGAVSVTQQRAHLVALQRGQRRVDMFPAARGGQQGQGAVAPLGRRGRAPDLAQ